MRSSRLSGVCGLCCLMVVATANRSFAQVPLRYAAQAEPISVQALAKNIDRLEKHLARYGFVTAKAPDVWGQARLSLHRDEFEKQMAKQLDTFQPSLNAEVAASDQATFIESLSLAAAIRSASAPASGGGSGGAATPASTSTTQTTVNVPSPSVSAASANIPSPPPAGTFAPPSPAGSNYAVTSGYLTRTAPFGLLSTSFGTGQQLILQMEPEELLDQRKRFLDHLHEIRRINEGDDTADSPGYSLNLVRIPISVMPGDKTRIGYGAEITVTAESYVTEELLPQTFRDLVINDLVDLLSLPVLQIIDGCKPELEQLEQANAEKGTSEAQKTLKLHTGTGGIEQLRFQKRPSFLPPNSDLWNRLQSRAASPDTSFDAQTRSDLEELQAQAMPQAAADTRAQDHRIKALHTALASKYSLLRLQLGRVPLVSRSRRARYPLPPSEVGTVMGEDSMIAITTAVFGTRNRKSCFNELHLPDVQSFLAEELRAAYDFLSEDPPAFVKMDGQPAQSVTHSAVREAFYHSDWTTLAKDLRNMVCFINQRNQFFTDEHRVKCGDWCPNLTTPPQFPELEKIEDNKPRNVTEALAWGVLVESALLNEQLNEDMQHVSQDPNCNCGCAPGPNGAPPAFVFYGPHPSPPARQAFVQYVKCRWPIHVFALDPEVQEQNVADTFSLRREMQMAFALAVAGGSLNAQNLTQYMRRIEIDMRTISLNRTIVGFGNGDDTFGWRFYPRFQTPDIEGNTTVFFRDLLCGGPNRDDILRTHRIEPGSRECVAIVLMPSFIHHVRFDTRGNWFELAPCTKSLCDLRFVHRGDTGTKLEDAVAWSREVRFMEDSAAACGCQEQFYRPGEVERLLKRVKQLSARLPTQTLYSRVPNDNTIGGFQMFSSGVTDLAPELIGYYGAPGVDPQRDTVLFLVGNHFSVHGTRVVAGSMLVDTEMLSRQVMKAKFPAGVRTETYRRRPENSTPVTTAAAGSSPPAAAVPCNCPTKNCCEKDRDPDCQEVVVVHLATPYGVTSDLEIPVQRDANSEPLLDWAPEMQAVTYQYSQSGTAAFTVADTDILIHEPRQLEIRVLGGVIAPPTISVQLSFVGLDAILSPTATLTNIALNSKSGSYLIDPVNFGSLHVALKNAMVTYLAGINNTTPPPTYTAEVQAATVVNGIPIPLKNRLKVAVHFVKK